MRYYDVTIRHPESGSLVIPAAFKGLNLASSYTSYINGRTIGGALDMEMQFQSFEFAVPAASAKSFVRFYGVSLEELNQAHLLEGYRITVKGGMQKGLPLANPSQNGVVAEGWIYQCYGNWQGAQKTLDLNIYPVGASGGVPYAPNAKLNFMFVWKKGTQLRGAIESTLSMALPVISKKINISNELVATQDFDGSYTTLAAFGDAIKRWTNRTEYRGIKTLGGGQYAGVNIAKPQTDIIVYDDTSSAYTENTREKPKQLNFVDLIGQPTWLDGSSVNFKTVMRADIKVGDYIKFPRGVSNPFVLLPQGVPVPGSHSRNSLTFDGIFKVRAVFQFGRYRSVSEDAWVTSFDVAYVGNWANFGGGGAAP
jgi:hypothetical protein